MKWWKFNEGAGDITKESAAGDSCAIAGHMSYWKQGVSGTALAFDGYHSVVRLPAEKAPAISDAVTLEGLGGSWCLSMELDAGGPTGA